MARFTVIDSPPAKPDRAADLPSGTAKDTESTNVQIKKEKRRSWLKPNFFKRTKASKTLSTPNKISPDEELIADSPIMQEQPRMVSSRPSRIRRFNMQNPQRTIWKRKTMTRYEIVILMVIALPLLYVSVIRDLIFDPRECDTRIPHLTTQNIQRELEEKLFGQDIAMHNLTKILKTHSGLTTLNFLGSCGTGKSFTANIMAKHFEESFHPYHWANAEQEKDEMHVRLLQDHILDLSQCKPSLVVVDNLSRRQRPHVEDLHRWLMNNSRWNRVNLVVVFIFNFDRYGEDIAEEQEMRLDTMGGLRESNLVIFKSFQEEDGKDFLINKIGVRLNVDKDNTVEDIVRHANVPRYGLKKLSHKFHVN